MAKKRRIHKLLRGKCEGCGSHAKLLRGNSFCCKYCKKLSTTMWKGATFEWNNINEKQKELDEILEEIDSFMTEMQRA